MSTRFVILHHQVAEGEHWDMMLEHGEVLLTWQLLREPVDRSSLPVPAKRIGNHRKRYLDYEGPVSGGRGDVRRVDSGSVNILQITDTECLFELSSPRLSGRFRLAGDASGWVLEAAYS